LFTSGAPAAWAKDLPAPECRPLLPASHAAANPARFRRGLLWQVTSAGASPNYLFGTIHVADERILRLPDPVGTALSASKVFVMEVVPDLNRILLLSDRMFFTDGASLRNMLPQPLYEKTVNILHGYNLPAEAVAMLKPWAAFMTMNYPPEAGAILDLELLRRARDNGAEVYGLETMDAQIDVFDHMELTDQLRLLIDSICHYELIAEEFEMMKDLYLRRDLQGLVDFNNRFTITEDDAYRRLFNKLIIERNRAMAESMRSYFDRGGAFIAIGAMHLPGEEGVLRLLERKHYTVTVIY
jgi:hypothetical protein